MNDTKQMKIDLEQKLKDINMEMENQSKKKMTATIAKVNTLNSIIKEENEEDTYIKEIIFFTILKIVSIVSIVFISFYLPYDYQLLGSYFNEYKEPSFIRGFVSIILTAFFILMAVSTFAFLKFTIKNVFKSTKSSFLYRKMENGDYDD